MFEKIGNPVSPGRLYYQRGDERRHLLHHRGGVGEGDQEGGGRGRGSRPGGGDSNPRPRRLLRRAGKFVRLNKNTACDLRSLSSALLRSAYFLQLNFLISFLKN
jgi:hypothetical protein